MNNLLTIKEFDVIDSTQDYAHKILINNTKLINQAFIAHEQTTGKGREDSIWNSPSGGNLYSSIIIKILKDEHLDLLGYISCLALFNSLYDLKVSTTSSDKLKIKWPNDLLYNYSKFAGILVDIKRQSNWAVIGLGCNLKENKKLSNYGYFNINASPKVLLQKWYMYFKKIRLFNRSLIIKSLNNSLAFKNKSISIRYRDNSLISGILLGIAENGSLLLKTNSSSIIHIYTGDIISGTFHASSH